MSTILDLSPEAYGKITGYLQGSRKDLLALYMSCKKLQPAAEPLLFSQILLTSPATCLAACTCLVDSPRLAQHVRRFVFAPDVRAARLPGPEGQVMWKKLQAALEEMKQLDSLVISDTAYANSWIFGSQALPDSLRELRLRAAWDEHTVLFVARQQNLRLLQIYDAIDDVGSQLHRALEIYLPKLETFDGTLSIGVQFSTCPLFRLQLAVDCETSPALECLKRFRSMHKTLKALCLVDVTEELGLPVMGMAVNILPELRYLGVLPYPVTARHRFHTHLMSMHHLQIIELDVKRWYPLPSVLTVQRVLADEVRMYCPSIRTIVFWLGTTSRSRWSLNEHVSESLGAGHGMWATRTEQGVYPQMGEMWRMS